MSRAAGAGRHTSRVWHRPSKRLSKTRYVRPRHRGSPQSGALDDGVGCRPSTGSLVSYMPLAEAELNWSKSRWTQFTHRRSTDGGPVQRERPAYNFLDDGGCIASMKAEIADDTTKINCSQDRRTPRDERPTHRETSRCPREKPRARRRVAYHARRRPPAFRSTRPSRVDELPKFMIEILKAAGQAVAFVDADPIAVRPPTHRAVSSAAP